MDEWTLEGRASEFDQDLADSYVGKTILVGIAYFDYFGRELEREQMHGVIESARPEGVRIALQGERCGEHWTLPPALEAIYPAKPGRYSLRSTGEVVHDPDFWTTWKVTKPLEH